MPNTRLNRFVNPKLTRWFLLRFVLVAGGTYLLFGQLLIPLRIQGHSMAPTYRDGRFNFCWRLAYVYGEPARFDVVAIRLAGRRVMLLKRVVGLPGETISFQQGTLYVNQRPVHEPYVRFRSPWNMESVQVDADQLFVVGDNRGVPMNRHHFGRVHRQRIMGEVLW